MKLQKLTAVLICCNLTISIAAQSPDSIREYTQEHPLVYEDVWDLWPYSFLNEEGEPDGFNVDLIRMMMKELNIPYIIKLKPSSEAFRDLKEGNSDLMLGLKVGFHDEFGKYSENAVTLFTQSVVTPKKRPTEIKRFRDLANHMVIVNDSSLCHHLMIEYGWEKNALPVEDMREAIQRVSLEEEGQIVWNTLSLKYLLQRYHIDNLQLSPVNMQHGQYKFMSNDAELLRQLDKTYTQLYSDEKLTPIQNKWFYPEKREQVISSWVWYVAGTAVVLMLVGAIYGISYRIQARRLRRLNNKQNKRLALILETSSVRIWTYDVKRHLFAWRNENGQVAYEYTINEFSTRYRPADFVRLQDALEHLSNTNKSADDEHITLNLQAKDEEGGDTEYRDYLIVLSVLIRDKGGRPSVIIGTKKDVTDEHRQQRLSDERTLRYWSIFYTPMVGILLFDKHGVLVNINPTACVMFHCNDEEILAEQVSMRDILDVGHLNPEELDDYVALQTYTPDQQSATITHVASIKRHEPLSMEYRLMTVYDDDHQFLCVLAVCRDITAQTSSQEKHQHYAARVEAIKKESEMYRKYTNQILSNSLTRLVSYSPESHMLTICDQIGHTRYALTPTRCMTLVDSRSNKQAMHLLNDMDARLPKAIDIVIRTTLRVKGIHLELRFVMRPFVNQQGIVVRYDGLCQDISIERDIDNDIAQETAKVQEVENTKNNFIKNMVQEIRTPMNTITRYVSRIDDITHDDHAHQLYAGIFSNADYLLHLIDDILYLSRLQAGMVDFGKQPYNFAAVFQEHCERGWGKYRNNNTHYIVENTYDQLVIDIDADNIGHAIEQIAANAAQHTHAGVVRARYEYIGRRLIISMDDTGEGIPMRELQLLNSQDTNDPLSTKGLGLAICRELVQQMGGNVEISSDAESGTTLYIVIPCHATTVKRKKQVIVEQ